MRARPTIYDVARAAGVAPSTVSRALTRPGRVSAQTAELVRRAAEELGYARAQAAGEPDEPHATVALVMSDITNPHSSEIVRGAERAAADAGYTMLLCDTRESPEREADVLARIVPAVAGVVLASSRLSDDGVRRIAGARPTVVINRLLDGIPNIVLGNARGVELAVEHLRGLGHERIGYVSGPAGSPVEAERRAADSSLVRFATSGPTLAGGAAVATEVVASGVSAVVAYNDLIAIGLLRALPGHGVRVPGDVAVVGFDNIALGRLVTPELTSIEAPLRAMGEAAMRSLLRRLATGKVDARSAQMPVRLVVRGSTGPPAQRNR